MQLSEQSTSSLPAADQPNVCKIQTIETATVTRQISRTCFIVPSSSSSSGSGSRISTSSQIWDNFVASILNRFDELGQYVKQFFAFVASKFLLFFHSEEFVYKDTPLSTQSARQLELVERKTLVLDLDETLVHSCYIDPESNETVGCNSVPSTAVPDYVLSIPVVSNLNPIEFQVYKRPHVDEFLDFVSKWYDVVVFTASLEAYASIVIDKLDAGRGIFQRRFYRQHCTSTTNFVSKNLFIVDRDLTRVFIIDNSPSAYRDFPQNALPIKSFIYNPDDEELVNLLPFLDALRFTRDVRNVLGRRVTI